MKQTELVLAAIAIIGLSLSLAGIPGGSVFTIFPLFLLSAIYCYLGFVILNDIRLRNMFKRQSYKGMTALRILGAIGAGIILSTAVVGIMFKWMMWPGASVMLFISIPGFLALALITFIKYSQNGNIIYKKLLIRVGVIGTFVLLLTVFPDMVMACKYRNNPEYLEAVKAVNEDPSNPVLQQKEMEERQKIERMEGVAE